MTNEEAKNWLNRLYVKADITDEYGDMVDMQPYSEAIDMAIQALEQTRWIPVSERLPEDGTYLICTDDGYIATIMYDRSIGWLLSANIIAWMPLPQPYKGESEE